MSVVVVLMLCAPSLQAPPFQNHLSATAWDGPLVGSTGDWLGVVIVTMLPCYMHSSCGRMRGEGSSWGRSEMRGVVGGREVRGVVEDTR